MAKQPAKKTVNDQPGNNKLRDLEKNIQDSTGQLMNTNTGVPINDDQNSLKSGERGSTLLEDFILREKITHFDHERIPERVVHARGSGAHGVFKLYEPQAQYTKAQFLNDTATETPVFVRFSTVAGSRGSSDLARDARGFAVKFYTMEGNFDLVGNNIPVFFIQDAMKFPDLIHAVKPEPDHEMPQAASAHDTFWDFISVMPESAHMVMWTMSDRAIPRSYRMMEGFGVHTFRLVNSEGASCFVKFHWKPLLGVHSVTWDEAQTISGKDPDFHRRDLWDAIDSGQFPEWELGLQIVPEEDEFKFDFDLLDPTKLIPEELVPVRRIGKMTLNRNPDNFFAETEQAAFHVGHVVPGIDFTNDPLLQGRLFSYTDTQLIRLGGPNFQEIPINRPIVPVHNNQRDGHMRQTINRGKTSYGPNTLGLNAPMQAKIAEGGFASFPERIDARKVRARSKSFRDHFSQATLFVNSQTEPEKNHIVNALSFELGKVQSTDVRERMLGILSLIDKKLAERVAFNLRMTVPEKPQSPINRSIPADADPADYESLLKNPAVKKSAALSMANGPRDTIQTRKIAFLAADGASGSSIEKLKKALEDEGAVVEIISPRPNYIVSDSDKKIPVQHSLLTAASVLYDAVYVPGGKVSIEALATDPDAKHFLNEAFKHCKAIAADSDASTLLAATGFADQIPKNDSENSVLQSGIVVSDQPDILAKLFIKAIAQHRFWDREQLRKIKS
jgi:catalase